MIDSVQVWGFVPPKVCKLTDDEENSPVQCHMEIQTFDVDLVLVEGFKGEYLPQTGEEYITCPLCAHLAIGT